MANISEKYVVVEFLGENSVGVVPYTWILRTDQGLSCYWPRSNISNHVSKRTCPDKKTWAIHRIRVFGHTDDLQKARQKAKLAAETSNIDTDEGMRRKKWVPLRLLDTTACGDDGVDEDDEDTQSSSTQHNEVQSPSLLEQTGRGIMQPKVVPCKDSFQYTVETNHEMGLPEQRRSSLPKAPQALETVANVRLPVPERRRISLPKAPLVRSPSSKPKQPRAVSRKDSFQYAVETDHEEMELPEQRRSSLPKAPQAFQVQVLMKLQEILENQREMACLMKKLLSTSSDAADVYEEVLPRPCETAEEIEELCAKIDEDDSFKKNLIRYLNSIGGLNHADSIRRMMRRIATNAVWSLFSMRGRGGKMRFDSLPICKVILRAHLRSNKNGRVCDAEEIIAETLKYAPHRIRARKQHPQPKEQRRLPCDRMLQDSDTE